VSVKDEDNAFKMLLAQGKCLHLALALPLTRLEELTNLLHARFEIVSKQLPSILQHGRCPACPAGWKPRPKPRPFPFMILINLSASSCPSSFPSSVTSHMHWHHMEVLTNSIAMPIAAAIRGIERALLVDEVVDELSEAEGLTGPEVALNED
jgi:hypothetical protein